jgi:hypothetical protein
MSFRGGGGGRGGRGGGGGRSATTRNGVQIPMGTMTWSELSEVDKQKPSKSYPQMEEQPIVSKPTPLESKIIRYQLQFLSEQKDSIWWPVEEDRRQKSVPRFTDKYLRKEQEEQEANTLGSGQSSSSLSLQNDRLISTLQKDAFPVGLWNSYMTAETKRQEKEKMKEEQKKNHDWKRVLDRVEVGDIIIGTAVFY